MTEEQKLKLLVMAEAFGKPEVEMEKMEHHFIEGSVMFINQGHLVGILNRKIYDSMMKPTDD